jgi:signal transduction histidine kinase/CheY-like chemotaxis protein
MTLKDIHCAEDLPSLMEHFSEQNARLPSNGYVTKHRKKDGSVISVEISSRVIMFDGREAKLALANDITERKKLEAQFLRAQRIEGIGTLATGMAHDLNNILAPILISAGTLRWGLSADEQEKAINRIEVSVKRGAGIIQQVLTFGRGLNGERAPINAAELIDEVTRIVTRTFPKDIVVSIRVDEGLWTATGDRTQIHQVLLNLCVNARDAMPNGGKLMLRARNVNLTEARPALPSPARPGPYLMLQVSDSGCGIAAEDRERIFDPFFTTKDIGKGTGLGLSTVLGIVKSHHGAVMVESELGKGTTFRALLPASPETVPDAAPYEPPQLPRGDGEAVLIVDDEPDIVSGVTAVLEQQNYRVLVAKNGIEALAVVQRYGAAINAMVTDIMMPEMDGVQLIRVLRKIHPRLQIIASSGLGTEQGGSMRAPELEALNVRSFLVKPYDVSKLLAELHTLLRAGQGQVPPTMQNL